MMAARETTQTTMTAREIAEIIGLKRTAVVMCARLNNWLYEEVRGNGGLTYRYAVNDLPVDIQLAIRRSINKGCADVALRLPEVSGDGNFQALSVRGVSETLPAVVESASVPAVVSAAQLTDGQKSVANSRAALLSFVDEIAEKMKSISSAVAYVARAAQVGGLPGHLQSLIPLANARKGGITVSTIWGWYKRRKNGFNGLIPRIPQKSTIKKEWMDMFMQFYGRQGKPSVSKALEEMAKAHPEMILPSISKARRYLDRLDAIARNKGRLTGNEMQAIKPFRRRSTEELMPADVYVTDGHTFKALIAHPFHGRPFRPEVCAVLDAATRRAIRVVELLITNYPSVATSHKAKIQGI